MCLCRYCLFLTFSLLFFSSGKATGGRLAPLTPDRKVTSPVTTWPQLTPYRLKSENSLSSLTFCLSRSIFNFFSLYLTHASLVLLWLRQHNASGRSHFVTNPSHTHGRESKQWGPCIENRWLFIRCDRNITCCVAFIQFWPGFQLADS